MFNPSEMNRRKFLKLSLFGTAGAIMTFSLDNQLSSEPKSPYIMTVNGPIKPSEAGIFLPHEHVMVDFIGADQVSKDRYNADDVYQKALPYLKDVYKYGCRTLVECTPDFLGRDPLLLKKLSDKSKLNILTNTGLYGAGDDKYIPSFANDMSADELADKWISEWKNGIENTGIKPGFIKIGVNPVPSNNDMKLLQAAALTHLSTGLPIASHTVTGAGARRQIEKLIDTGVHPSAFIWVHAHAEPDISLHKWAGSIGAWLEYDGLSPQSIDQHFQLVKKMRDFGLLHRVMLSHDAGWYNVGEPDGGVFRSFDTLFTEFIPHLKKEGLSDHHINQMIKINPSKAFAVRVRRINI